MCVVAVVAERPRSFTNWLGPELIPALSRGQVDGWGASMFLRDRTWNSRRFAGSAAGYGVTRAMNDELLAVVAQGQMLSVGESAALTRTPPFRRGRWVFAHSGVLEDVELVKSRTSLDRQRQCGPVASELLFAYLLSRLDERDLTERDAPDELDEAVAAAVDELANGLIGSATFVLSDGDTLYAYRRGRPVHMLEAPADGTDASALAVTSSRMVSGPWAELDDRTLLRYRRGVALSLRFLSGCDPRMSRSSEIELPFTD